MTEQQPRVPAKRGERTDLVQMAYQRPAYPVQAQEAFGITASDWQVLVESVFPNAKTTRAVWLALSYCKARKLDIFKRPIHIVPIWNSAVGKMVESVWPGISELRTTASRTGAYAGKDAAKWGKVVGFKFTGEIKGKGQVVNLEVPEWCEVTVYRMIGGQRCAFCGPRVYWIEAYARAGSRSELPNDMWRKRGIGQLEKCAEAAALRAAFPEELGNEYAAEEVEGKEVASLVTVELEPGLDGDSESAPDPGPDRGPDQDDPGPEPDPTPAATAKKAPAAPVVSKGERSALEEEAFLREPGGDEAILELRAYVQTVTGGPFERLPITHYDAIAKWIAAKPLAKAKAKRA